MKKNIILRDKKIVYALKKSKRARRMRLAVYCDGSIVITTPFDLSESWDEIGDVSLLNGKLDVFC